MNQYDYASPRGAYHEPCEKIAYATEVLAASALRRCKSLGRPETGHYHCPRCEMFHLTSGLTIDIQPVAQLQIGTNTLDIAKSNSAAGKRTMLRLSFQMADERTFTRGITMTHEQATGLLDALILAIYDNEESDSESEAACH